MLFNNGKIYFYKFYNSMLPKISTTDYIRCYPKRLKKIFQSNLNMRTYDEFIPYMKRAVVGNIPPELIRLFPKDTRGADIKKLQDCLADISKYARASFEKMRRKAGFGYLNPVTYRKSDEILNWERELTNVFNSCLKRISGTPLKGELEYIDYGVAGRVFRLSIMDKNGVKVMHDKALKVYHKISFAQDVRKDIHGSYAEANFWTYLKHAAGHRLDKSQFTKHYISDLHNGYCLTEYIDQNITRTTAKINFENLFGIKYVDANNNAPLCNKIYDAGGFKKLLNFMDDKIVLRHFKKLFFRTDKELPAIITRYEALVQNPNTPHRIKFQKALSLFKEK